ncbi:FtsW/RodA/SpoVE family cell cycle protein [Pengzhenrongella frigida]|uniref:FtsW/RodA/SpoVE family cell cycle protein n=1 Tax=Pengzhenrongella frigida TaxID=1259133 RepID=A0A4Q5N518_9MICO|nr:FtsW/RodA/SpoVE family cell cycle protein [Cellulomonas sp. HLT2-17]RYV51837.1 FtsW/RodA/SpoVE family cell cycle protein [Cellulomonas sp. HLT2-17]
MATVTPHRVRPGRGVELGLLVLALGLGVAAYALVGLNMTGALPANIYGYSAGMVALGVGMHLVLRLRAPYADQVILPVAVALNGIGLAMIYRIDLSTVDWEHPTTFATRQLGWTAIGMILAAVVLVALRDHRTLRRYTYTAMVVGLGLVLLPLVPGLGTTINGARIWVRLGGQSLQPAEFAKIALAIFFAGYLVTNRDTLALAGSKVLGMQFPRVRDLGPIIVVWAASLAVLVLERDLGTSLLFFGLFVAMLYLATERKSWIFLGMLLFLGGAALAAQTFSHVGARFDAWLNAFDNDVFNQSPGGSGQLVRGLYGMANGGLFGTGWGEGRPDLVPYAESDFIVASLGEELGLTGLLAILVAYLVLAERGLRTAIGVRDGFGKLLAGGLAFVVAFQCFVVVGGVTRLIPLTGLTMPFMAYGGSSLLANWVIVALLLRISDSARRPAPLVTGFVAPPPTAADRQDTQMLTGLGEVRE